jgi:hypothetical protein
LRQRTRQKPIFVKRGILPWSLQVQEPVRKNPIAATA